jgi:hypothetical protein
LLQKTGFADRVAQLSRESELDQQTGFSEAATKPGLHPSVKTGGSRVLTLQGMNPQSGLT